MLEYRIPVREFNCKTCRNNDYWYFWKIIPHQTKPLSLINKCLVCNLKIN
jgi:hypothetical protein